MNPENENAHRAAMLKHAVMFGRYWPQAGQRYPDLNGGSVNVVCDNCGASPLLSCIALRDIDLCLSCVDDARKVIHLEQSGGALLASAQTPAPAPMSASEPVFHVSRPANVTQFDVQTPPQAQGGNFTMRSGVGTRQFPWAVQKSARSLTVD